MLLLQANPDGLSDDGESVGSHSSHHSDDAAKASDDEVVECSPRSSKESVAEGSESDIAGSDISEGFAVPNVRELPFTSTPRAESAPRLYIARSVAKIDGKRITGFECKVSERPKPTRIDAGDCQLDPVSIPTNSKDMTPSISEVIEESVANLALSDLDDDIIVLDSDTEDAHVSRKEKAADKDPRDASAGNIKPVNPQLEPELITIESSSDEEKRSANKDAPSPSLSPQLIRQVTPLEKGSSKFKGESISSLENRLKTARNLLSRGLSLPDGGQLLRKQIADIEIELERRKNGREIFVDETKLYIQSRALLSQPDQNQLAESPEGLTCPLKEHQQSADEMGLGKTLCMISLIVAAKAERKLRRKEGRDEKDRERKQKIKARGIARADVVITTYTLLANEVEKGYKKERARPRSPSEKCSPLEEVHWARIILDEAHQIKNKSTKTSRAVCRLEADARWCVTEKSADRLNLLMKTYVLRREKNFISQLSGKPLVELPLKHCEDHMIEFEEGERIAYDIMFQASR
ncbi:hypothetical protein NECAME_00575 [Necator americanus]|uniref:SNF2 N-terminal domain-containing protein n=1 Tax=Necator americanus TaxID=51031 RepID=W2T0S4_NECAM|nr:hypothetical protein NECAME_00575 [Necator americanus]ETN75164.1 hypothetical protein NECAME_00575 [Necator americanus]